MPAKAPIYLKTNSGRNVAGTAGRGGKKLRDFLSTEMISLPMGDFRHTAHVGRGADDVFGDTTFLRTGDEVNLRNGFGKRSKASRNRSMNGRDMSGRRPLSNQSCDVYGMMDSPNLQSAISLPLLSQDSTLSIATTPSHESKQAKTKKKRLLQTKIARNKAKSHETGLNCLHVMADQEAAYQRVSRSSAKVNDLKSSGREVSDKDSESLKPCSSTSTEPSINSTEMEALPAEETLNIDLDFGPSLLDEVLCELDKIKL